MKEAAPDIDTGQLHALYIRLLRAATSARMPDAEIEDWKNEFAREPNDYLAQAVDGVTMGHRRWLQLDNERPPVAPEVQRLLQRLRRPALPGSRGAAYLQQRGLPLALALQYGVGYPAPGT